MKINSLEAIPNNWPKEGFRRCWSFWDADRAARELGIRRENWQYISREEQLRGIQIPSRSMFFFINVDIPSGLIETRIRK